jgi:ribosomal protein S18 acetylase RimI-like enzyme
MITKDYPRHRAEELTSRRVRSSSHVPPVTTRPSVQYVLPPSLPGRRQAHSPVEFTGVPHATALGLSSAMPCWENVRVRAEVDLVWPTEMTDELAEHAHTLIRAVTELGGAIGWPSPPRRAETDQWLSGVMASIAASDAEMCTVWQDGRLVAMGLWRREEAVYFRHLAWLAKIMVHPGARGGRLGQLVTRALIASATDAGIEMLQLGVRGNNHLAIQLYEEVGFVEWGRLPNAIEVGDERFDDVRMYLRLNQPAHVVLRGNDPSGPGSSLRRPP